MKKLSIVMIMWIAIFAIIGYDIYGLVTQDLRWDQIISTSCSLILVIFAGLAFNTWKEQINYSHFIKLIEELIANELEYFSTIYEFLEWYSKIELEILEIVEINEINNIDYDKKLKNFLINKKSDREYKKLISEYTDKIYNVSDKFSKTLKIIQVFHPIIYKDINKNCYKMLAITEIINNILSNLNPDPNINDINTDINTNYLNKNTSKNLQLTLKKQHNEFREQLSKAYTAINKFDLLQKTLKFH